MARALRPHPASSPTVSVVAAQGTGPDRVACPSALEVTEPLTLNVTSGERRPALFIRTALRPRRVNTTRSPLPRPYS